MVFKNTCESLLFAMRAVSSVAHQPHLGFLSGCDRELKHGFTFPLSSSSDAGDPPDTCIMQSCNRVIRRISLWPLIGGEPRSPYPTQAEGKPPCPPVHLSNTNSL